MPEWGYLTLGGGGVVGGDYSRLDPLLEGPNRWPTCFVDLFIAFIGFRSARRSYMIWVNKDPRIKGPH